ncbi:ABC transporter ATP-binding protein [Alkalibaculum bacchi]|uniref:ABC transporter ATP-binding protein n=1 Tax=Alkalibaculum bacchi TaxID=645887 RepID=UPI0026EE9881|nr:ABC transporter ATP-binding protein [Alkalibaculum bacchi]
MNKKNTAILNIKGFTQSLRYCLSLSWKASKFYTLTSFLFRLLTPIMEIIAIYLSKEILDTLVLGQNNLIKERLINLFILFGIITVFKVVNGKFDSYVEGMLTESVNGIITAKIIDVALNSDIELFDNPKSYDKLALAVNNTYVVSSILRSSISFLSTTISFLIAFTLLLNSNWIYCLVLTIAAFPSAFIITYYTKLIYLLDIEQISGQREKDYYFRTATSKVFSQDIRLHNLANIFKNKYISLWRNLFEEKKKKVKSRTISTTIFTCVPVILSITILIDVVLNIIEGYLTIGDYSLYSGLITQLLYSISTIIVMISTLYDNRLRIENIREIENLPRTNIESGTILLESIESIEFRDVWFAYPNTEAFVLKGINFKIHKGERVALVGINGSGKSTIIKLLLRFYVPTQGLILINGINIKDYNNASLHEAFCCYFQNAENYAFTLREDFNLSNINKKENEYEMHEALKNAGASAVYNKLYNGLDTYISKLFKETGAEMSIGEQQMISLSRTFYRNSQILILDEPSSSLDPEAEDRLFQRLQYFCDGKTVLFTSHRLSNIKLSTRILVIEDGEIIEDGPQEVLLQNSSRYKQLFDFQANKYKSI